MLVVSLVFLVFLVVVFVFITEKGTKGLGLRLGFSFLQIIVTYPKLSSDWDPIVTRVFEVSSIANANVQLLGITCYMDMSFWTTWHIKLLLPFLFAAILGAVYYFMLFLKSRWFKEWNVVRDKYIYFFTLIMITFYISLVSTVTEPLNCVQQYGNTYAMLSDMSIECYAGEWNNQVPAIAAYTFLYFVCVPVGIMFLLWKAKRDGSIMQVKFMGRFGCLTKIYAPKFFYWEVVSMAKKCLVVGFADFLSSSASSTLRIVSVLLVLVTFGSFEVLLQPYRTVAINRLNYLWMSTAILMLIATFVYRATDTTGTEQTVYTTFLIVLLCIAILASVRSLLGQTVAMAMNQVEDESAVNQRVFQEAGELYKSVPRMKQLQLLEGLKRAFREVGAEMNLSQQKGMSSNEKTKPGRASESNFNASRSRLASSLFEEGELKLEEEGAYFGNVRRFGTSVLDIHSFEEKER